MAKTIGEYPIDSNVQLVIEDVRVLREELRKTGDEAAVAHLTQIVAGYFVINRAVLDCAFDAWEKTPEDELQRMCSDARPLDESATVHSFSSVARFLIPMAPDMVRGGPHNLVWVDEDNLHMMLRVLEYAKYLADCSERTVQWHPIGGLLTGGSDRIEDLRTELLAH